MKGKSLSRVRLLVTPWTAAYQAPPSTGFARQEYWSGLLLPSPNKLGSTLYFPKMAIERSSILPVLQQCDLAASL